MYKVQWYNSQKIMCKLLGNPVQDLSKFQMAPIPFLSDLTCSTHSPESLKKIDHLPIGHVKRDVRVFGGCDPVFCVGFWLILSVYALAW